MRWVVFLAILIVVLVAVMPALRTRALRVPASGPPRRDELVKDPVCHTYVVLSRAVSSEADGRTVHFCSRECADRYRRGERDA